MFVHSSVRLHVCLLVWVSSMWIFNRPHVTDMKIRICFAWDVRSLFVSRIVTMLSGPTVSTTIVFYISVFFSFLFKINIKKQIKRYPMASILGAFLDVYKSASGYLWWLLMHRRLALKKERKRAILEVLLGCILELKSRKNQQKKQQRKRMRKNQFPDRHFSEFEHPRGWKSLKNACFYRFILMSHVFSIFWKKLILELNNLSK